MERGSRHAGRPDGACLPWLLDGADYVALGAQCAALNRWEFLFTISPLKLNGCTASPVNPIAML